MDTPKIDKSLQEVRDWREAAQREFEAIPVAERMEKMKAWRKERELKAAAKNVKRPA